MHPQHIPTNRIDIFAETHANHVAVILTVHTAAPRAQARTRSDRAMKTNRAVEAAQRRAGVPPLVFATGVGNGEQVMAAMANEVVEKAHGGGRGTL